MAGAQPMFGERVAVTKVSNDASLQALEERIRTLETIHPSFDARMSELADTCTSLSSTVQTFTRRKEESDRQLSEWRECLSNDVTKALSSLYRQEARLHELERHTFN